VASDSDSQVPIFLERVRSLFRSSDRSEQRDGDRHQGTAIAVCVLLSLVLWLSLTLQEERTVSMSFPVEVVDIAEDRALTRRPPSSVTVQLAGNGMDLIRLVFNPPVVDVSASQGSIGVQEALRLPRANDAQVLSVRPSTISLDLEPRLERRLPVRPRVNLQLASTFELIDAPLLEPDSVTVSGAESVVSSLSAWPTDSLTLENVRDTVRREVPLEDTLEGLVSRSADRVAMTVRTGKFAEETREVKVEVTGVPAGQELVTLQPSTIRIRYRVLFDQLFASRRSSEFFATVSYSQIRSDTTGSVEPRIHVPSDLVIRDPEPIPPRVQYYTFLSEQ
jgi:YbbR domain-containing protein